MAKKKKTKETKQEISAVAEIRKQLRGMFGQDSIKIYDKAVRRPAVATGVIKLDKALGGGVAEGRMLELVGDNSSGKTTVALSIAASYQQKHPDSRCIYIDVEHALDTEWAEKLGINFKKFEHVEPDFAEDAIFMLEAYLKSGETGVAILDSVAAMLPKTEMENDIGDANIGLQARLISSAMRRINLLLKEQPQTVLIFINQKRARIAGGGPSFAYEPSKSTGGKALPFYMTTRINLAKIKSITNSKQEETGQMIRASVTKHKIFRGPGGKTTFQIDNTLGIDTAQELLEFAIEDGRVEKAGSWLTFVDHDKKVQGEEAAKRFIRESLLEEWKVQYGI